MSSIKLKHASGNGVIISAPSSNPAADRTLTLPSDADGVIAKTDASGNLTVAGDLSVAKNVEIDSFSSPSTRTLSLRTGYAANANGGSGLAAKDHSGAAADGLGIYGTDGVSIHTANAGTVYERMRVDTSGRVGIGTSSPQNPLTVAGNGDTAIDIVADLDNNGTNNWPILNFRRNSVSGTPAARIYQKENDNALVIDNNSSERMRIDTSGNLLVGTTSADGDGLSIRPRQANGTTRVNFNRADTSDTGTALQFLNNSTTVGTIKYTNSATQYNTSSDYRLKENATAISDGIARLKTLKPYRFNFKVKPDTTVDGFFAHEVTAVPEAISGTKDEVVTQELIDSGEYEKGTLNNPIYQGIDQSKLVPLLTAALQEAVTKIEVLETKVAALESK